MSAIYCILLRDLALSATIGIHPFEKAGPQRLLVNIAVAMRRVSTGDRIEAVVDYDYVRDEARKLAAGGSYALQETFCEALIAACRTRSAVLGVAVSTRKPDVYPDCGAVGCLMSWIEERHRAEIERLFGLISL